MYDQLFVFEIVLYDSALNIPKWKGHHSLQFVSVTNNQSSKIIQGRLICDNDQRTCG